jgi:hypothetical protein
MTERPYAGISRRPSAPANFNRACRDPEIDVADGDRISGPADHAPEYASVLQRFHSGIIGNVSLKLLTPGAGADIGPAAIKTRRSDRL